MGYGIQILGQQIREDWQLHFRDWTLPGFRAIAVYRIGHWIHVRREGILRNIAFRFYLIMYRYVRNQYGIELPATASVGRRLLLGHQSGIVIHPYAVIGDDCMIRQNVTIGSATPDRVFQEAPKLGNGVQVGAGAVIVGKVTIGDGARIGPTAVVLTNVPAGASVFVAPPRIIQLAKRPVKEDGTSPKQLQVEHGTSQPEAR